MFVENIIYFFPAKFQITAEFCRIPSYSGNYCLWWP